MPVTECATLLVEAAQSFFPNAPIRIGLRDLGRSAFPGLIQTIVGRVVLSAAADMPSALQAGAKAYVVASRGHQA